MCAALKFVDAFALSLAGATPMPWGLIYPQDARGRPSYNPKGKYVVKLWVAGAWRAVTIDDRMPVDANGYLVLSSSAGSPRELWPTLMAKALYKLYSMSSLGSTFHDLLRDTREAQLESLDKTKSQQSTGVASFVAFAVQAMTGGLPDILASASTADGMLDAFTGGGTPMQPYHKFSVDFECQKLNRLANMSSKKKRKKKGKKEVTATELKDALQRRTDNIASIRAELKAPRPQVFMVCFAEELRKVAEDQEMNTPTPDVPIEAALNGDAGAGATETSRSLEPSSSTTPTDPAAATSSSTAPVAGGEETTNPEATTTTTTCTEPPEEVFTSPSAKFTIYPVLAISTQDNDPDAEPQLLLEWAPKKEVCCLMNVDLCGRLSARALVFWCVGRTVHPCAWHIIRTPAHLHSHTTQRFRTPWRTMDLPFTGHLFLSWLPQELCWCRCTRLPLCLTLAISITTGVNERQGTRLIQKMLPLLTSLAHSRRTCCMWLETRQCLPGMIPSH